MTVKTNIPEKLELALNVLAERIKFSEPINSYQNAQELFIQDTAAQKILKELSAFQRDIRQKQYNNQVTTQDLEKLRSLQTKAQENKVIISYSHSQQEAIGQLREFNAEISNLLGIDFASLAKKINC
ncbi:MAG: YlbF family regulator [Anaerolineaceae bacterium]|nr:YlbF family regulator [Anaerolineaceae bacterium]